MSGLAIVIAVLTFGMGVCGGAIWGLVYHIRQLDELKRYVLGREGRAG